MASEEDLKIEEKLFNETLKHQAFAMGKQRCKLFEYLYLHRDGYVTVTQLVQEVLDLAKGTEKVDDRLKSSLSDLRKHLKSVAIQSESPVHWILPEGLPALGYRLQLSERPTITFWKAHQGKYSPLMIYTEPIFFYDIKTGSYLRFLDVNPPVDDRDAAIEALVKAHGAELRMHYPGESLKERLRPTHIYVGMGEMDAMESLQGWFSGHGSPKLRRIASDAAERIEILGSPILFGGRNTNGLMDAYLGAQEASCFEYKLHPTSLKCVSIHKITAEERRELSGKYDITDEGGEWFRVGNNITLDQTRDRLVILYRMRVPGSQRLATMLASEATLGIRQVAIAITEDKKIQKMIHSLMDQNGALPDTFEALFSVKIAPTKRQHEAGDAELIAVRKHSK